MPPRPASPALAALLPTLALALAACRNDDAPAAPSAEDLLARQRAAAFAMESEFGRALETLAPLAERDDAALDDLVHAAAIALEAEVGRLDDARRWIGRARELAPDDARVRWALYRLAQQDGDFEAAEEHLRAVLAAAPDDLPARLALGAVLTDSGQDGAAEAERLYREIEAVGPDFGGSWYAAAIYRLFRLAIERGDDAEAARLEAVRARLAERGVDAPSGPAIERGSFGAAAAPEPHGLYPLAAQAGDAPRAAWTWGPERRVPLALAGPRGLLAYLPELRLPDDPTAISTAGGNLGYAFAHAPGPEELLVFGDGGLARAADGGAQPLLDRPVHAAVVLDLGDDARPAGDGDADVVVALADGLLLLEREGGALTPRAAPLFAYPAPPAAILALDVDHEGDLDLLLVGPDGATLLRNDAAHAAGGAFVDATAEAGLPRGRALAWAVAEDLDRDNDVDLLLGGPGGVAHFSNERGGRFSDASAALPSGLVGPVAVLDVDGDGWADLRDARGAVRLGGPSGAWRAEPARPPAPAILAHESVDAPSGALLYDAQGDGAPDLARLEQGELVLRSAELAPGATAVRLALLGVKDNARGVGALVEIVLGSAYRRAYVAGPTLLVATHGRPAIDVLRVTWPNGVVQNLVDAPASGALVVQQRAGLIGSCPFLYTWNGERFVFVSDVLGAAPLGLPMEPGMLVPADHDEFVLIQGDRLVARDGELVLQITEELREVTYLDRVRLDVVDHPADVEVFPNERFTFPPFPEPHVHAVADALAPVSARDGDGRDWTRAVRADDGDLADPFRPLGGQFQGLTEPWHLELAFDPERVGAAPKLRLVMNGWLYWMDASVNVASARHPSVAFVPPTLQVPDGEGGWRDAGVLGFPAGKLKTMVVDVSDVIDRADPRIRVHTTLELYWDSIRLAVDADDAPRAVSRLEPSAAELWQRGFSRALPHPEHARLETFDWEALDEPRWNQHPGAYTRLGDCRELVLAADDRFAILGAGDALTLRFPAEGLPSLPEGWTRDYLLYLDGWAKDRDPNTIQALYVEPLPFHGMSAYPYGADESYPDDEAHRAYRREWNTRPARRWIPPLAPR